MIQTIIYQTGSSKNEIQEYVSSMSDADLDSFMAKILREQIVSEYAKGVRSQLEAMPLENLSAMLLGLIEESPTEALIAYYDEQMDFSESSLDSNLRALGYVDISSPASINLYASSFENKEVIENVISEYNSRVDELSQIKYVDYVGIMMSSITTIINTITPATGCITINKLYAL